MSSFGIGGQPNMLEGPGSRERLRRVQHAFRRHGPRKRFRVRARSVGLVAFGAFIGAGSMAVLDQTSFKKASDTSAFYSNCREAIQAGAAPVYWGQPGYGAHLDADNDGIGCEPYRPG